MKKILLVLISLLFISCGTSNSGNSNGKITDNIFEKDIIKISDVVDYIYNLRTDKNTVIIENLLFTNNNIENKEINQYQFYEYTTDKNNFLYKNYRYFDNKKEFINKFFKVCGVKENAFSNIYFIKNNNYNNNISIIKNDKSKVNLMDSNGTDFINIENNTIKYSIELFETKYRGENPITIETLTYSKKDYLDKINNHDIKQNVISIKDFSSRHCTYGLMVKDTITYVLENPINVNEKIKNISAIELKYNQSDFSIKKIIYRTLNGREYIEEIE